MSQPAITFNFAVELLNNPPLKTPLSVAQQGTLSLIVDVDDGSVNGTLTITNPVSETFQLTGVLDGGAFQNPAGMNISTVNGTTLGRVFMGLTIMEDGVVFSGSYLGGTATITIFSSEITTTYVVAGYTT